VTGTRRRAALVLFVILRTSSALSYLSTMLTEFLVDDGGNLRFFKLSTTIALRLECGKIGFIARDQHV
jgi:hypothetical protein